MDAVVPHDGAVVMRVITQQRNDTGSLNIVRSSLLASMDSHEHVE